ncbi:MAG: right-handed parallel beta-helix repeat-containing protein, partial [Candidatus Hydrogenedentes bacterium]|nr:right-handed parallel beta-helix repeat-containing protein [Candidatus Hydrogenedentota bacterium]
GEWWHDIERGELLVIAPDGRQPAAGAVSVKARVAGFEGRGTSDVIIDGLEFRGCNARFTQSRRVVLRNCRFLYPSTPRVFQDLKTARKTQKNLHIEGEDNVVERCLIEWAVDTALEIEGAGNRVENCVVHDCNLHGRHPGPGISTHGVVASNDASAEANTRATAPNVVRRCTVYNVGGVGIYASGAGSAMLDHNHVFNAGLHCVDVASLYVPVGRNMPGTVVHHNWLHDIHGIGFRVDIEGRAIVFHHNLVWNASVGCKMQGFQLEGYNNTLMVNNPEGPLIVVFEQAATPTERAGWRVRNNAAYAFVDRMSWRSDYQNATRPFMIPLEPEEGAIDHNVAIQTDAEHEFFVDAAQYDFRPKPDGPLDAAGVAVPGFAEGHAGRPPSIGALETHEAPWTAGADWMNDGLPVPTSTKEATVLAQRLRPANRSVATPAKAGSQRP